MEGKKLKIGLLMGSLIKESTYKYLQFIHPKEGDVIKVKTDANSKTLSKVLDEFFDLGYSVSKVSRKEFIDEPKLLKINVKK